MEQNKKLIGVNGQGVKLAQKGIGHNVTTVTRVTRESS
mgnify:CR=1 FL=1